MPQYHQVQQGDYLAKIAAQYGFTDYRPIWEHPHNAPLKTRRQNPNMLYPGDVLYIPDMQEKQESRGTNQRHTFQVAGPTVRLRVALQDPTGEPLRNLNYTLRLESELVRGKTDGAGMLEAKVPVGLETAYLIVDDIGLEWILQIGRLDPVDEAGGDTLFISGIQARLNNLGFACGTVDGILGPQTKEALKRFQQAILKQSSPDGELDAQTRLALKAQHGC